MEECLRYVKTQTESEWARGDTNNGLLTINRGMQALIRVINDIVDMLVEQKIIFPKTMRTEEVFNEVRYYLDPLIDYLNSITPEQRKDLRGFFGGGADARFWRAFQKAIADVRSDFNPEKLREYWLEQAKTFNEDSIRYLREIKVALKTLVEEKLHIARGDNWLIKGLPRAVYTRAKKEADDQNYDLIAGGVDGPEVSIWDCVTLAECKDIVTYGKNWSELFEKLLTRPQDSKISGGKENKTEWITKLNSINNKLAKDSYSVSTEEYTFIKEVYEWISSI